MPSFPDSIPKPIKVMTNTTAMANGVTVNVEDMYATPATVAIPVVATE